MKESIIHHTVTAAEAQTQTIVITGFTETITKNNILGIINETKAKIVFTPMVINNISATFVLGTLTITLAESAPTIATGDALFIKIYTDAETISGDYSELLAEFFGITAATQYTALTDAEVIACCRDEQYNVMGDDWPIPAWLPDGLTEQDIQTAATALGITYHAPTETPSES